MPPADFTDWLDVVEREAREAEEDALRRMALDREAGVESPGDVHYRLGSAHAQIDLIARIRRMWLRVGVY